MLQPRSATISIVTSLYRSGPYVDELYRRCIESVARAGAADYEFVFVNDASPDDSLEKAKALSDCDHRVKVVDLARNFGQHRAMMTGLSLATGDYVFLMDSDLEEEPEWIELFYREMMRTNCDVVYGVFNNKKRGSLYSFSRWFFYRTLNYLAAVRFPTNVSTARIMSRRYVDALLEFKEREIYLAGMLHMVGFTQLPIGVHKLDHSESSYSFIKLVSLFVNAVTAFSVRPLNMIFSTGLLLSFAAIVYLSWLVYNKIFYGIAIEGWLSVMAVSLIIGGVSLLFNGVIAIYVGKIFLEVKHRPMTTVREIYQIEKREMP